MKFKTKYRVDTSSLAISKFNIEKETNATVLFYFSNDIKIYSERKESNCHKWCDTFEEAKEYLLNKAKKNIDIALYQLEKRENELKEIQNLKESEK